MDAVTSVLIVDDAPAVRDGLRRLVSTLPGVRAVALASSGEEALVRYSMERPDLVLLDVRMPGMSGLECARRLLHTDPGVRIVMLTAGDDPQAVATAVANGAAGYISKDATKLEMVWPSTTSAPTIARAAPRWSSSTCPSGRPRCWTACRAGCPTGRSAGSCTSPRTPSRPTPGGLFRKLHAADRAQAVAVGLRAGLIS